MISLQLYTPARRLSGLKGLPFQTIISLWIYLKIYKVYIRDTHIYLNMVKLQRMVDGTFFATIRKALVVAKGWKQGDQLGYMIVGGEVVPLSGDIIIRKIG